MSFESFLHAFMDPSNSINDLSSVWVDKYKADGGEALKLLISLIFNSCDCNLKISSAQIQVGNLSDTVEEIEKEIISKGLPLNSTTGKQKKCIKKVGDIIEKILNLAQEDLLNDGYFFPHFNTLIEEMSKSELRDFRYTASSIAVKIITTLAAILKNLISQTKIFMKQLAIEENKDTASKSRERIESLGNSYNELAKKCLNTEETLKHFTSKIIPERFRDVDRSVRLVCLEELEVWIQHHIAFLDQQTLQYLNWALHDPAISMRLKSLQILKRIYSLSTLTKDVDNFTWAFKNHIIKMSLDKSIAVSVIAIQVIVTIFTRYKEETFKQEDKDHILKLVYSHDGDVGKEAATYLHECISVGRVSSSQNFRLRCLFYLRDFIIRTKGCDGIPFLVDSMIRLPQVKYLTDWKCYSDILLMDSNLLEESHNSTSRSINCDQSLTDTEEKVIIYLMVNSVKQAVLGECPRKTKGDGILKKKKELMASDKEKQFAISYFLAFLPKLMKKYMPDTELMKCLLYICLTFDPKYISENQDVCELVDMLMEVTNKHIDLGVHLACAKAMKKLSTGSSPTAIICSSNFLGPYLGKIASNWKMSLIHYANVCTKKQDIRLVRDERDLLFSISKNSEILWAVSCHFYMEDWIEWEELIVLCKGMVVNEKGKPFAITCEVIKNSLKTALAYIFHIEATAEEENALFKKCIDEYLCIGSAILQSGSDTDNSVRYTAFFCVSEIMCILHKFLLKSPSTWKETMEKVTDSLIDFFSAVVLCKDGFENLNKEEKGNVVEEFCSMILRGGLPSEAAVHLLKHFSNTMVITQSWTAVNTTLSVLKTQSLDNFTMIILGTLTLSYLDIKCVEENTLQDTREFSDLKKLATQLHRIFGFEIGNNRKAAMRFHLKGLHFATTIKNKNIDPLPRIHFVSILTLFSKLVHENDKKNLSIYLKDHIERLKASLVSFPQEKLNEYWALLNEYKKSLFVKATCAKKQTNQSTKRRALD